MFTPRTLLLCSMLAMVSCTVAIDDFERCDAPQFVVERRSCSIAERDCMLMCNTPPSTDPDVYEACLRSCTPQDSSCISCIFGIGFECTAFGPCNDEYQDLGCCSMERCGRVDFTCEPCREQIDALIECGESDQVAMQCTGLEAMCFVEGP